MIASWAKYLLFLTLALLCGCFTPKKSDYDYCQLIKKIASPKREMVVDRRQEPLCERVALLSLREAVERTLACQPDSEIAVARIYQAQAALGEANSLFYPIIKARTQFLGADSPSTYLFKKIDSRTFDPTTNFNDPGTFANFETDIGLYYQLYRGGRNLLQRWSMEKGVALKGLDQMMLYNTLTASVIDSYYSALAFREALAVVQLSKESVERQLQLEEERYREGKVLKSDLLLLQVRLLESEEEMILSQNSYALALASLSNLMGGDADTEVVLEEDGSFSLPQPDGYESALTMAICCRPELLAARKQVEIAGIDVAMKKRAFLPEVDLMGRVYWDDEEMHYRGDRTNWVAAIDFNWTIFEGGRRCYQLSRSRALFQEMVAADRKISVAVQLEIKQAYLQQEHAASRLITASSAVEYAEESFQEISVQYSEGVKGVADYLDAEVMVRKAHLSKIEASYQLLKAKAQLARAVGLFVPEGGW